jgi:CheY-like chemotaxis protein
VAIRNGAEILSRQPGLPAEARRPLAIVDHQTRHLSRLVDDLLDVARVTKGKIALQKVPCELGDLIDKAARQLERAAQQGQLRLQIHRAPGPVRISGDPVRIEQVFTNLLTNAVKYTPAGGSIDVRVNADADHAVVQVIDTGVGIAPHMLGDVFELFVQADRSLDRSQGGMGIGLTLVRLLVELHGGKVEANSAGLGKGSTFTVTLPLLKDDRPVAVAKPRVAPPIVGRHVLLVEDSADNREMLQALLELDGHRVDVAADGLQAVRQGLTLKPDVAIIDIGLPGIDGYEVAQRLRAELGPKIVLVALTGYGMPEDRAKAAKAGFDVHLIKPVGLSDLEAALQR